MQDSSSTDILNDPLDNERLELQMSVMRTLVVT
jgi:hypothetical protein